MSPIGKIFIVVNLALSAAFLGWASNVVATSQQWKTKHDDVEESLNKEKAALEADLSLQRTKLETVREDKDRFSQESDDLKNRAERAERERDAQTTENQQMRGDITKLQSSMEGYNNHLSSMDARLERATDQALQAERDKNEAMQGKRDAEIALANAEESMRATQAQVDALTAKLASAEDSIASAEAKFDAIVAYTGVDPGSILSQPDIEGAVVSVKSDPAPGLVSINRGSDQGVSLGTTFQVFNGRTYKGEVRVEIVHATWSSAVVVRATEGSTISSGDSVATRL